MQKWLFLGFLVPIVLDVVNCAILREKRGVEKPDVNYGGWKPILPGSRFYYGPDKGGKIENGEGQGGTVHAPILARPPPENEQDHHQHQGEASAESGRYHQVNGAEGGGAFHVQEAGNHGGGHGGFQIEIQQGHGGGQGGGFQIQEEHHGGGGGGFQIQESSEHAGGNQGRGGNLGSFELHAGDHSRGGVFPIHGGQHGKEIIEIQDSHGQGGQHGLGTHEFPIHAFQQETIEIGQHPRKGHGGGGGGGHNSNAHGGVGHHGGKSHGGHDREILKNINGPVPNKNIFAYYPPPTTPRPFPILHGVHNPKPLYSEKPHRPEDLGMEFNVGKNVPVLEINIPHGHSLGGLESIKSSQLELHNGGLEGIKSSQLQGHGGLQGIKSSQLQGHGGLEGIKSSQLQGHGGGGGSGFDLTGIKSSQLHGARGPVKSSQIEQLAGNHGIEIQVQQLHAHQLNQAQIQHIEGELHLQPIKQGSFQIEHNQGNHVNHGHEGGHGGDQGHFQADHSFKHEAGIKHPNRPESIQHFSHPGGFEQHEIKIQHLEPQHGQQVVHLQQHEGAQIHIQESGPHQQHHVQDGPQHQIQIQEHQINHQGPQEIRIQEHRPEEIRFQPHNIEHGRPEESKLRVQTQHQPQPQPIELQVIEQGQQNPGQQPQILHALAFPPQTQEQHQQAQQEFQKVQHQHEFQHHGVGTHQATVHQHVQQQGNKQLGEHQQIHYQGPEEQHQQGGHQEIHFQGPQEQHQQVQEIHFQGPQEQHQQAGHQHVQEIRYQGPQEQQQQVEHQQIQEIHFQGPQEQHQQGGHQLVQEIRYQETQEQHQQGGHQQGVHHQGGHHQGGHQPGGHQPGGHQQGGHQQGGHEQGGHEQGGHQQVEHQQGGQQQVEHQQGEHQQVQEFHYQGPQEQHQQGGHKQVQEIHYQAPQSVHQPQHIQHVDVYQPQPEYQHEGPLQPGGGHKVNLQVIKPPNLNPQHYQHLPEPSPHIQEESYQQSQQHPHGKYGQRENSYQESQHSVKGVDTIRFPDKYEVQSVKAVNNVNIINVNSPLHGGPIHQPPPAQHGPQHIIQAEPQVIEVNLPHQEEQQPQQHGSYHQQGQEGSYQQGQEEFSHQTGQGPKEQKQVVQTIHYTINHGDQGANGQSYHHQRLHSKPEMTVLEAPQVHGYKGSQGESSADSLSYENADKNAQNIDDGSKDQHREEYKQKEAQKLEDPQLYYNHPSVAQFPPPRALQPVYRPEPSYESDYSQTTESSDKYVPSGSEYANVPATSSTNAPEPQPGYEQYVNVHEQDMPVGDKEVQAAKDKEAAQVYHAYYAPADHKPPPGYIRLSVNEFNKYFKNAEIQYVGSESQNKDVSPNALGAGEDLGEKGSDDVKNSLEEKQVVQTKAPPSIKVVNDEEGDFSDGPVLTLDLKPGQSVEDALTELGTINVEGIRIDASQLKEGRDFEVVDVSPILGEESNSTTNSSGDSKKVKSVSTSNRKAGVRVTTTIRPKVKSNRDKVKTSSSVKTTVTSSSTSSKSNSSSGADTPAYGERLRPTANKSV